MDSGRILLSFRICQLFAIPIMVSKISFINEKLSIDNSHNYDKNFIKVEGCEFLYDTQEQINCGAVYIHGGLSLLSKKALKCIDYESTHCGSFAEQTVFALMDIDYKSRWPMEQITSEISDLLYPFFSKTISYKGMIARHYLWRLKWIYWKDLTKQRFPLINAIL